MERILRNLVAQSAPSSACVAFHWLSGEEFRDPAPEHGWVIPSFSTHEELDKHHDMLGRVFVVSIERLLQQHGLMCPSPAPAPPVIATPPSVDVGTSAGGWVVPR
jgi:hypothetical protein